ncbi:STM2901 family protein [Trinickia mobilis]|uniref:STM2901 family protein n=1 Tax=Trinickia mobilis TaxID=2816356 RepID=UPI001A8F814B|nr:hypothetical protein [Trinickia mobilis]
MNNTYRYGIHQNLTPQELFFIVLLDETCKQLGIDDLVGISMVLVGQPFIPTRGKFNGAVKGTSIASVVSRRVLPFELKHKVLPTVTSFTSLALLRIKFTNNLGAFVGRTIPGVGWVLLASDVSIIIFRSVAAYQKMVKPEDRI